MVHRFVIWILIGCLLGAGVLVAEPAKDNAPWNTEWSSDLTFAYTGVDNWVKSGTNQLNALWYNDMRFIYTAGKSKWRNTNVYTLAFARVDDKRSQKTDDLLEFETMYTRKVMEVVNPYAAMTVKTQLFPGFEYSDAGDIIITSTLFDPGYVTQSAGFSHHLHNVLVNRLGISLKETFADQYAKNLLEDTTKAYKAELGMEFVSDYKQKFGEWLELKSKLELFSELQRVQKISMKKVDVRWNNYWAFRLKKILTLQIQLTVLYDQDLSAKRQVRGTATFGVHYNIF